MVVDHTCRTVAGWCLITDVHHHTQATRNTNTHLRLLHRPVVFISGLNLSRQALVNLAQAVRQDAQVLLDFGLFFFLLQDLSVDLLYRSQQFDCITGLKGGGGAAVELGLGHV